MTAPRPLRPALVLAALCLLVCGCGASAQPVVELTPVEFQGLLEDPQAPYVLVSEAEGRSLGAKILAPEALGSFTFGGSNYGGLVASGPDHVQLRVYWEAIEPKGDQKVARAAMALFAVDRERFEVPGLVATEDEELNARERGLINYLDTTEPLRFEELETPEDDIWAAVFKIPYEEVPWLKDDSGALVQGPAGQRKASFLISLFLQTEDGLIVARELLPKDYVEGE